MLTFSLQFGSNGNAIYVETNGVRPLFNAGISGAAAKRIQPEHGRRADAVGRVREQVRPDIG